MTTGTVTSARLLDQRLPELGLERSRAAPFRPARRAGLGGAVSRPLAARRGRLRGKRNLAQPDRRLPRAARFRWCWSTPGCPPAAMPCWRLVPGLARSLFGAFARVQAQSEGDAGAAARPGRARDVTAPGNLKFAAPPLPADAAELARLRRHAGAPPGLARRQHPSGRGGDRRRRARGAGARASRPADHHRAAPSGARRRASRRELAGAAAARRGLGEDPPPGAGIWIGDTLGELGLFYRLAGIVFVGSSLVGAGRAEPAGAGPARLAGRRRAAHRQFRRARGGAATPPGRWRRWRTLPRWPPGWTPCCATRPAPRPWARRRCRRRLPAPLRCRPRSAAALLPSLAHARA